MMGLKLFILTLGVLLCGAGVVASEGLHDKKDILEQVLKILQQRNENPENKRLFIDREYDAGDIPAIKPDEDKMKGDPARDEELFEENTENGAQLLNKINPDPDSQLAKLVEGMRVYKNGKELTNNELLSPKPKTEERKNEKRTKNVHIFSELVSSKTKSLLPSDIHPELDSKNKEATLETLTDNTDQQSLKRNLYVSERLWEGGIVPYVIKYPLTLYSNLKKIREAFKEVEQKTCIRFVPRNSPTAGRLGHNSYIQFVNKRACSSKIGRRPVNNIGGQEIKLYVPVCLNHFTILHEIMHALGFGHEQSRSDRDRNVKIVYNNINSKYWHNFNREKTINSRPYDAESVLHYGLYSASKYSKRPTIQFLDNRLDFLADTEGGLDFYDVAKITDAYKCSANQIILVYALPTMHQFLKRRIAKRVKHTKCTNQPSCQNGGFVDQYCKCYCPTGLKGDLCEQVDTPGDCGGVIEVQSSETKIITSPKWPQNYPTGTKCTWLIKAPKGQTAHIVIDNLDLPANGQNKCYHWLEIRYNLIGQLGPKICGKIDNQKWSTSPYGNPYLMMLRFDAKFARDQPTFSGFKITVGASKPEESSLDPGVLGGCSFEANESPCFVNGVQKPKRTAWTTRFGDPSQILGPKTAYHGQRYAFVHLPPNRQYYSNALMGVYVPSAKGQVCLTFAYNLKRASRFCRFGVFRTSSIYRMVPFTNGEWKSFKWTLPKQTKLVMFYAYGYERSNCDLAIDKVVFSDGACG